MYRMFDNIFNQKKSGKDKIIKHRGIIEHGMAHLYVII